MTKVTFRSVDIEHTVEADLHRSRLWKHSLHVLPTSTCKHGLECPSDSSRSHSKECGHSQLD